MSDPPQETDGDRPAVGRLRLGQLLGLLGLTGFALSQPLLSLAGENPTLFAYNNVDGVQLIGFALVVALVPPLVLWVVVVLLGLVDRRAGDVAFIGFAVVLAAVTAVQVVRSVGLDADVLAVVVALAAAAGFGVALVRFEPVRAWLRYTAILPALAVGVFLFASPASALLESRDAGDASGGSDLPPVVFLMLDEFPTQSLLAADGTIDRARFPNLATFADEATWYRNYSVLASWTDVSVPSILSGSEPREGQALWTEYPDTIFSLLRPTHDVIAVESFTDLCGYDDCSVGGASDGRAEQSRVGDLSSRVGELWWDRLFPDGGVSADLGDFSEELTQAEAGKTRGDDRTGKQAGQEWAGALVNRPSSAATFVDALEASSEPAFAYLHLLFPHQPWVQRPDGSGYSGGAAQDLLPRQRPRWREAVEEQQHLWQASYTDAVVGEILDHLRASDRYDESVVVVTSDHGVAFDGTRADGRAVTPETIPEVAFAPLLVKLPGQREGAVDDANLLSSDLLPTVAEAIGVEIPWPVAGHAAGSDAVDQRDREKLIYDFGDDPLQPELRGIVTFDASQRPAVERRRIGAGGADPDGVAALVATIGLADRLGVPIDDVVDGSGGSVALLDRPDLEAPPDPSRPLGFIGGRVQADQVSDGERYVLIALNGRIVTAAPVGADDAFVTLLPGGVLGPAGNEIRVALVDGGSVSELTLS